MSKRRRIIRIKSADKYSSRHDNTVLCALCLVEVYVNNLEYLENGKRVCPSCKDMIQFRTYKRIG